MNYGNFLASLGCLKTQVAFIMNVWMLLTLICFESLLELSENWFSVRKRRMCQSLMIYSLVNKGLRVPLWIRNVMGNLNQFFEVKRCQDISDFWLEEKERKMYVRVYVRRYGSVVCQKRRCALCRLLQILFLFNSRKFLTAQKNPHN